jgi:hypothetical protein
LSIFGQQKQKEDSYEARLTELLDTLTRRGPNDSYGNSETRPSYARLVASNAPSLAGERLPLFEIARVLVRFNHVASGTKAAFSL